MKKIINLFTSNKILIVIILTFFWSYSFIPKYTFFCDEKGSVTQRCNNATGQVDRYTPPYGWVSK